MTGWQPGDGGQGNWNQPFGPDPGTNSYGTEPYNQNTRAQYSGETYGNQGDQYGGEQQNPYGGQQNPYGGEPYPYQVPQDPQYGQQPPQYGQTSQYPQYPQYQTGGFPAQGYGPPPPPPKRSKLPMILSLVAIVIIVGAVVAIVVVNRNDGNSASPTQDTTTQKTTEKSPSSKKGGPSSGSNGDHDDWISVDNTADAGLSYQVPPDWKAEDTPRKNGLGVDFTGNAEYGSYDCQGSNYIRSFAASGDVQGKDGTDLDLDKTAGDFAKSFATSYYGDDATVDLGAGEDIEIDGKKAVKLTAKITPTVTVKDCQATSGEVALVGVLIEAEGQPAGVAMLAVVNDLAGGPTDPKPLDSSISQDILSTVTVK